MPDQFFQLIVDGDKPNQISTGLLVTPSKRVISYLMPDGKVEDDIVCVNEPDPDYLPLVGIRTRRVNEQYPYPDIQGFRAGNNLDVVVYMQPDNKDKPLPIRVQVYMQQNGEWVLWNSTPPFPWGIDDDSPVGGEFDGQGHRFCVTDPSTGSVYCCDDGVWSFERSTAGVPLPPSNIVKVYDGRLVIGSDWSYWRYDTTNGWERLCPDGFAQDNVTLIASGTRNETQLFSQLIQGATHEAYFWFRRPSDNAIIEVYGINTIIDGGYWTLIRTVDFKWENAINAERSGATPFAFSAFACINGDNRTELKALVWDGSGADYQTDYNFETVATFSQPSIPNPELVGLVVWFNSNGWDVLIVLEKSSNEVWRFDTEARFWAKITDSPGFDIDNLMIDQSNNPTSIYLVTRRKSNSYVYRHLLDTSGW